MNLFKSYKPLPNVQSEKIEKCNIELFQKHHDLIEVRLLNYESGITKSFSWNEVCENARTTYIEN